MRFLIVPLLWAALALPAMARKLTLDEISAYLNSLKTAEAAFTQINGDGSKSTGRLFIKRPGRVRFEYDPPQKALVLASAGTVAIFDPKSNQAAEQYPLKRTPLNLILKRRVDLKRAKMVVGHKSDGKTTTIIAQDPKHPEYGTIELVFASDPVRLKKWIINDDAGGRTVVILEDMKTGVSLQPSLFSIPYAEQKLYGRRND